MKHHKDQSWVPYISDIQSPRIFWYLVLFSDFTNVIRSEYNMAAYTGTFCSLIFQQRELRYFSIINVHIWHRGSSMFKRVHTMIKFINVRIFFSEKGRPIYPVLSEIIT
ncbi:hypothetical protein NQ317_011305, partial [Molorchus minor]